MSSSWRCCLCDTITNIKGRGKGDYRFVRVKKSGPEHQQWRPAHQKGKCPNQPKPLVRKIRIKRVGS